MIAKQHNASRRRGTVMVMVVVVIVLMMMLGAAYMQMARVQRVAPSQNVNNIDLILQSIIDEIKLQLENDVRHNGTDFFVPNTSAEPYDYAKTNFGVTTARTTPRISGAAQPVAGGEDDDTWLADLIPYEATSGNPATLTWHKITSLTGGYFGTDSTPTVSTRQINANATNADPGGAGGGNYVTSANRFEDILVSDNQLVDADGDGIGDAMWERAPMMVLTGTEYFMAVRIVDASALLNLLAATAKTADGDLDYITAVGETRGYYPTEVDLTRLLAKRSGVTWSGAAGAAAEIDDLFTWRGNVPATLASGSPTHTPFGPISSLSTFPTATSYATNSVVGAWLDDVSIYGDLLDPASELLQLQWRAGMKSSSTSADIDAEMPLLLDDPYNETLAEPISTDAARSAHFLGTTPGSLSSNQFGSIRHMVTTVSGHGVYAPNHSGIHSGTHTLKQDLVDENSGDLQARADSYFTRLQRIYNMNGGSGTYATNVDAAATQMALAMVEYSDADSVLTATRTVGSDDYYGLETLPFMAEAYVQLGYEDTTPPPGDTTDYTWTPANTSLGIAVEIRNPFDRPIRIGQATAPAGPQIRVVLFAKNGSGAADLVAKSDPLPSSIVLDPRNDDGTYSDSAKRVIVLNGAVGITEDSATSDDLVTGITIPATIASTVAVDSTAFAADGRQLVVGLQTLRPGGSTSNDNDWVTYDRLTDADMLFPSDVSFNAPGVPPAPKTQGFIQHSLKRDGRYIRYLSNTGLSFTTRGPDLAAASHDGLAGWPTIPAYAGGQDNFGDDDKGTSSYNTNLDNRQLPMANRPFFSVAELGWIMTVGFHDGDDGDFPQLLDARSPLQWQLDLRNAASPAFMYTDSASVVHNVTHAQVVMDQFTTISPRYDGVDNDNDDGDNNSLTGADNEEEQLIPGTININSAPLHLLALAVPLPENLAGREGLMAEIVNLRDTNEGFRSIGELLAINGASAAGQVQVFGSDGAAQTSTVYDLYPMEEEVGATPYDAVIHAGVAPFDENEDKLARFQFLSQVLTTRSDIYIAHILAKGYSSGGFGNGPVETGRMIVVFSRAKLVGGGNGEVEVLAAYKY